MVGINVFLYKMLMDDFFLKTCFENFANHLSVLYKKNFFNMILSAAIISLFFILFLSKVFTSFKIYIRQHLNNVLGYFLTYANFLSLRTQTVFDLVIWYLSNMTSFNNELVFASLTYTRVIVVYNCLLLYVAFEKPLVKTLSIRNLYHHTYLILMIIHYLVIK